MCNEAIEYRQQHAACYQYLASTLSYGHFRCKSDVLAQYTLYERSKLAQSLRSQRCLQRDCHTRSETIEQSIARLRQQLFKK